MGSRRSDLLVGTTAILIVYGLGWNKAGRGKSTLDGEFHVAAQGKKKTVADVSKWMDPDTNKWGYVYDKYEPVADCPKKANVAAANPMKVATVKTQGIKLGRTTTKVSLAPLVTDKKDEKPLNLNDRVKGLPPEKRLRLIVKGLATDLQPGVVYNLYLDLPDGASGDKAKPHFVGTINFFNAMKHATHGNEKTSPKGPGLAAFTNSTLPAWPKPCKPRGF